MDLVDVFYWPCGTWCYADQLAELLMVKSDDYQLLQVLPGALSIEIDADVCERNRL